MTAVILGALAFPAAIIAAVATPTPRRWRR